MRLGPVTKLDKKNTARSINFTITSCLQILAHSHFFDLWPIWSNPAARFRTHGL